MHWLNLLKVIVVASLSLIDEKWRFFGGIRAV
jgi:hypothetical protein